MFLVVGGLEKIYAGFTALTSTEIFVDGWDSWRTISSSLPIPAAGLKAINHANTIITLGRGRLLFHVIAHSSAFFALRHLRTLCH